LREILLIKSRSRRLGVTLDATASSTRSIGTFNSVLVEARLIFEVALAPRGSMVE